MGEKTRLQLITEGCLLAGRSDAVALAEAVNWLNNWLSAQYKAWPWPFLLARKSLLALPAGTQTINVGNGNSAISERVKSIPDSFFLRTSTYQQLQRPRLKRTLSGHNDTDIDMVNPATRRGPPEEVTVRPLATGPTYGAWQLQFYPVPDKAYLLSFDYYYVPASLSADSAIPIYPEDRTMVKAVQAGCLEYSNGIDSGDTQACLEVVSGMIIQDRINCGQIPGTNDVWGLDPGIFE